MSQINIALVSSVLALGFAMPVAEARVNTVNLSCRQAQDIVHSRGAIVMSTGRNTYDRFVADRSYCPFGDYVKRAYVPTRDRRSCDIGFICTPDSPLDEWDE